MCLNADPKVTANLLKRGPTIRAWKVLGVCEDGLHSVFQGSFIWKPGVNRSNRLPKISEVRRRSRRGEIVRGIHVFLVRKDAVGEVESDRGSVVPVTCEKTDLVAGGEWLDGEPSAVFTKVRLTQKAYDKAMREGNNETPA